MKHQIAYTLLLLTFATYVQAQNSSPYWSIYGNTNATGSQKLGTYNSYPLRIITNNSTRIYIGASNGYVGVGTTSPSSRLHINAASGTSPFKAQINGSTKLYMSSGGGLSVGSGSTPPSNGLYVAGNVGIGTSTPSYKLHVNGTIYGSSAADKGIYGYSSYSTGIGVYGQSPYIGVYGRSDTYGLFGNATQVGVFGEGQNYGIAGDATSSSGYGMYGQGGAIGVYGSGSAEGVYGYSVLYGVYGYTYGGGAGNPSGVYGFNDSYGYGVQAYGRYGSGVYASGGTYAGYFTGPVYSSGGYSSSDRKLKKNIADFTSAMDMIDKLHPKSYEYRQDGNYKLMRLPEGTHYGLIAQDLEQVLPNLVKDTKFDPNIELNAGIKEDPKNQGAKKQTATPAEVIDFKAVNYTELIPIMIKGMQEQQKKIDELQALVNKLLQERGITTSMGTLSQNAPNPAKSTTRISYALPANTSRGQLLLTDNLGKTIRVVSLNTSGVVDVNTAALSSGVYNYSLMVDGKVLETRKMEVVR